MKVWIIQGSLNPKSNTSNLTKAFEEKLKQENIDYDYIDLRNINMEFCDWRDLYDYSQEVQDVYERMQKCDTFVIGMPVYQYTLSWALKNFLDIMCGAMYQKAFAILTSSGSTRAYMSVSDLVDLLFFEVEWIPVPPVVHITLQEWQTDLLNDEQVNLKMSDIITNLKKINN